MDKKTYAAIRAEAHKRIAARKAQPSPAEPMMESAEDNTLISFNSVDALIEALHRKDQ